MQKFLDYGTRNEQQRMRHTDPRTADRESAAARKEQASTSEGEDEHEAGTLNG